MKEITYSGYGHFGDGYWKCTLSIPTGWKRVKKGKTCKDDKCMNLVEPIIKNLKNGELDVKGFWETIFSSNVDEKIECFRAIIRKLKRSN